MNIHNNFSYYHYPDYPSGYTYTRPIKAIHSERSERGQHTTCPFFSVVICTHNRRNIVLAALASLRKQTLGYEQFEVIVIDNNSTDGTFNAVQTYLATDLPYKQRGEKIWQARCMLEAEDGLVAARQTGIREATGEIVVFLDDDTIADTRFLENLRKAYEETSADAIGGRVDLYWEAPRPYWLSDDLFDTLGYFAPFKSRAILPDEFNVSSCCFSIKRSVLQTLDASSPLQSQRGALQIKADIHDLCRRLRQGGYHLWYEPTAFVLHRVPSTRLVHGYFIGKAYWDGRAEIIEQYANCNYQQTQGDSFWGTLRSLFPDVRVLLTIALGHQLLLFLARKPTSERLYAAMAQAHTWGRIRQQFLLSNHAPVTARAPAMLLVCDNERSIQPLVQGLKAEGIHCESSVLALPFAWMWRYRTHQEQRIGAIHLYNPGAFHLNIWQRLLFLGKIRLAHHLGLLITSSDNGGWWHNKHGGQATIHRAFERMVLASSDLLYMSTTAEKLHSHARLRTRSYFYTHPGMIGVFSQLIERKRAYKHFGLPKQKGFIYLCFVQTYSEREILRLIDAFIEMQEKQVDGTETMSPSLSDTHLLLLGKPEKEGTWRKMKTRAEHYQTIHLFGAWEEEDLPYAVEAADVLVLPYLANKAAGVPEHAMLFYSYERVVVAPDLPRFQDLLPLYASVLFDPTSRSSLIDAMIIARSRSYHHTDQEARMLAYKQSWQRYAYAMIQSYRPLLPRKGRA
jgi:glycosyltransferase involved in cell wall biosynthesis